MYRGEKPWLLNSQIVTGSAASTPTQMSHHACVFLCSGPGGAGRRRRRRREVDRLLLRDGSKAPGQAIARGGCACGLSRTPVAGRRTPGFRERARSRNCPSPFPAESSSLSPPAKETHHAKDAPHRPRHGDRLLSLLANAAAAPPSGGSALKCLAEEEKAFAIEEGVSSSSSFRTRGLRFY